MNEYVKKNYIITDDLVPGTLETPTEEWIWVTGYKGTDKDMMCMNNFQYELGKRYDMPEGEPISACSSGFHLCLNVEDVFDYITLGQGHRFFEVRALVRERDVKRYKSKGSGTGWAAILKSNKLAAKSIEIVRELTVDEILAAYPEAKDWSDVFKQMAIDENYDTARNHHRTEVLVLLGYARPLAEYICKHCDKTGYDLAVALDAQPGISMDTKINAIFSHI